MEGFIQAEEAMIQESILALQSVGYDTSSIKVLIRADLPATYRGMSLPDGAALGTEAFRSQAILNHVLEEELLHLRQRAAGAMEPFEPGTARALGEEVDAIRKFHLPDT